MPLQIIRQDITKLKADAIVNTTNEDMVGYSGVDRAIHNAAGPELDAECARLAPLRDGEVIVTGGYRLDCKYIIHTSGPVWEDGKHGEREQLTSCYVSSLTAAYERGCETAAVPLISAGVYGYPKDQAIKLAVHIITDFLLEHEVTVYLCVFGRESYAFSKKLFFNIQSFIDDNYVDEHSDAIMNRRRKDRMRFDPCDSAPMRARPIAEPEPPVCMSSVPAGSANLDDWMRGIDAGFSDTLLAYIKAKGMNEVECYKRANIDKKTFWKIKNVAGYKPSKQTAVAFAIALRLTLQETQHLLNTVGMSLSHSFRFDLIIEYFITHGNYDLFDINEALFEFDQPLLGCE